jgi:hypothetical protein
METGEAFDFDNWWHSVMADRMKGSRYIGKKAWIASRKALLKELLEQTDGSCGVRKCIPMNYIRDELEKLNGS